MQSSCLSPLQRMAEDINDQASDFTASSVALSSQTLSRLEDINTRYILKKSMIWHFIVFTGLKDNSELLFKVFPSKFQIGALSLRTKCSTCNNG